MNSVSTTSHSLQSSLDSSSMEKSFEKRRDKDQEEHKAATQTQTQTQTAASSSPLPNNNNTNDIFQIIEEECYNGQLQQQEDKNQMSSYKTYDEIKSKTPPPVQAFQNTGCNLDDDQVHYIESQLEGDNVNVEEKGEVNYEDGEGEGEDDDDDAPIIYAHHDDDSISQITSSIAGNSLYSSEYMLSRLSTHGGGQRYQKQLSKIGHRPFSHSISSIPTPGLDVGSDSGGGVNANNHHKNDKNTPLMDDEELDKFFGTSAPDSEVGHEHKGGTEENQGLDQGTKISTSNSQRGKETNGALDDEEAGRGGEGQTDGLIDVNIYTHNDSSNYDTHEQYLRKYSDVEEDDDLTLKDMYSIGPSVSNNSQRTFHTAPQSNSAIISFIQQAKLTTKSTFIKAKHTINRYFFNSSNVHQKKDDDHDQSVATGDNDYFSLLMSPSFVSSPPNSNLPHHRKNRENLINVIWISCVLILIWVLLYLAKVGNDAAWEKHKNKRPGQGIPMPLDKLKWEELNNQPVMQGNEFQTMNELPKTDLLPMKTDALDSNGNQLLPKNTQTQPLPQDLQPPLQVPNEQSLDPNSGNSPPNNAAIIDPSITMNVDTSHVGLPLPEYFNNFVDVDAKSDHSVPFFWHVPRAAGSTIDEILGVCYHLRIAANAGAYQGHGEDQNLQLLDVGAGHSYVNVNIATSAGIQRAAALGLVPSGLSDVVVSALVNEAGQLYDPLNQGRIFTLLRHPVDRAVSLFYFLQDATWKAEATFDQHLANISITDFYRQKLGESNWLVRYLTNQVTKPYVDERDLNLAKEILRRKCLVGLTSKKEESIARFEKYFGWHLNNEADKKCLDNKLKREWTLKHPHGNVEEGSELWDLIASHNYYDMQLYDYAKILFAQQVTLLQ